MFARRLLGSAVLVVGVLASSAAARPLVPFKGSWSGSTVSAVPISPTVVFVVTQGSGNATHLGRFELTIPHYSFLDTLRVEGDQLFTAANGDTITASFTGQLAPAEGGCLAGPLHATITGGTGRFTAASGSYVFDLLACPAASGFGFDSTATFDGNIAF
jgi:hypothetical protein